MTLKMKDDSVFRLSHLSIRAAMMCTSQLKTGIFFVTDTPLSESQLAVFDEVPTTDLASKVKEQSFGAQAQLFTVVEENGQLEVEVMETGSDSYYTGKYLTIK